LAAFDRLGRLGAFSGGLAGLLLAQEIEVTWNKAGASIVNDGQDRQGIFRGE
jgi:hypothetical protein